MAFARGKITAGLLGLSLCGLAAVASSTGRAGSPLGCHKADDAKPSDVPVKVVAVPVQTPPPVEIPPPSPPALELPKLPGVTPAATPEPIALPVPQIELTQVPAIPPVAVPTVKESIPPAIPAGSAVPLSPPAAVPQLVVPDPAPAKQAPVVPDLPAVPPGLQNRAVAPDHEDALPHAAKATAGVKVVVTLNGSQPSLTILHDGAEMLTVTCEQLDLAARGPGDDSVSAIKATGKVQFQAPGCRGTCDELVINPKTWDGTMFKNVRVTCRQGSGESELTAEKMVFKLRGGKDPLVSTVPAGHLAPARKE
jgi:hypothetical protein